MTPNPSRENLIQDHIHRAALQLFIAGSVTPNGRCDLFVAQALNQSLQAVYAASIPVL